MSLLQKFEKFALTKEQGNSVKGGEWLLCRSISTGQRVYVWNSVAQNNRRYWDSNGDGTLDGNGNPADIIGCSQS